mmetsp:Transcript_13332/g.32072  ORF Transcript_13332/g.32072 Transcript_13332/m.32072 type:complete len:414 (-) Transcript_13332:594-1835(-)
MNRQTGGQDGRCFLVKGHPNGAVHHGLAFGHWIIFGERRRIVPRAAQGCHTQSRGTIGMLILGQELNEPTFLLRDGRNVGDVKVHGNGGARINTTNRPKICPTRTNGLIRNVGCIFSQARDRPQRTRHLELGGRQHLQRTAKGDLELPAIFRDVIRITVENATQGFLEHRLSKRVTQHHETTRSLDKLPHFQQTHLIQTTSKDIHSVERRSGGSGSWLLFLLIGGRVGKQTGMRQLGIILASRLVQGFCILGQVGMTANIFFLHSRHNGAGSTGTGSTRKEHDASSTTRNGQMQQRGCHAQGTSRGTSRSLVAGYGPRVATQIVQNGFKDKGTFRNGQQETFQHFLSRSRRNLLWLLWLARCLRSRGARGAAQQFSDAAGRIFSVATENVGFGNTFARQFVDGNVGSVRNQTH